MPHCCIAVEWFNTRKDGVSLSLARRSPICQALDERREKHSLIPTNSTRSCSAYFTEDYFKAQTVIV